MEKITWIIGITLFTFGCNTATDNKKTATHLESESTDLKNKKSSELNGSAFSDLQEPLWDYKFDTIVNEFKLVKSKRFNKETLTPKQIAKSVNETWPKIQLKYLKISNDTVFVSIPESNVLTQQMGTAGADAFMISTTYSFTELKGIQYVMFNFDPGDHANPGVYSRNSWKHLLK